MRPRPTQANPIFSPTFYHGGSMYLSPKLLGIATSRHRTSATRSSYNHHMSKSRHLTLRCPECQADLKIDSQTGEVIFHKAATKPPAAGKDFEKLLEELKEEKSQAEEIFEREIEAHKNRDRLLEEKFEEALRRAEESPDDEPPPRPFDLD